MFGHAINAPKYVSDQKGQQRGCQQQRDGPGKCFCDHVRNPARVVDNRVVEIEAEHVGHVREILLPQGLVKAEFGLELRDHIIQTGLHRTAEGRLRNQFLADWIYSTQPWQQKVEGGGSPNDRHEYEEAPEDIGNTHRRLLSGRVVSIHVQPHDQCLSSELIVSP